jgi:hypothetical protein
VVVAVVLAVQSPPAPAPAPTGTVLAPIPTSVTGQTIDGIQCQAGEQLIFHIHAHLAIYVNSNTRVIPDGIGIMPPRTEVQTAGGPAVTAGSCFYWLHAHTADGIIHIESPIRRTYTLGNFFDVWRQPLEPTQVGPISGRVTAIYDGRLYQGNPRDIPLTAHAQIQLELGTPLVSPVAITFPGGL